MKSFSRYGSIKNNSITNAVEGWISNILNGRYCDDVLQVNSKNQIDAVTGFFRINDTEYKIIENYNLILKGDYTASGTITIVSEREVCLSCNNVIKRFSSEYKNIEIRVIDSLGNMYIIKEGVVQKYFFTFQNEYWDDFEHELREILGISKEKNMVRYMMIKKRALLFWKFLRAELEECFFQRIIMSTTWLRRPSSFRKRMRQG